ncbi:MAG: hypothetical protein H5T85_06510 [Actinobacteria bacterium]|nr:hypothetical protein [Actinomycetota bacterium]
MSEQIEGNNREIEEGKKVLGGVIILLWVVAIFTGIGYLSRDWRLWFIKGTNLGYINLGPVHISLPSSNGALIFLALFVASLVGIYSRKNWAVPVGRAALVVTMIIFFPIGTIFGAILWKRFNDPVAKKYLNYPVKSKKSIDEGKKVEK